MSRKLVFIALLMLALLPMPALAQSQAEWTIIYYSAADNDLEAFMVGDLMEMHLVGSTDQVNIVVQMDRVPGFDESNGTFTDTRRYYVEPAGAGGLSGGDFTISRDTLIAQFIALNPDEIGMTQEDLDNTVAALRDATQAQIEEIILQNGAPPGGGAPRIGINLTEVEGLGESETGDPATLVDFATWAIDKYPAEKYVLMLSNHGGGWTGVAFDETSENNALTMSELDAALAEIVSKTGIEQFDLVAFDACLMGQLEVYATIAPYAKYSIASQEIIPGAGWEYVTPLMALTQNPDMDVMDFGKAVIDGYMDYYTNVLLGYDAFDLHLIDLSKIPALVSAIDSFTLTIQANPDANLLAIGRARDNAQIFSQSDPDTARLFSAVDLVDFMRLLQDLTDDTAVKEAAQGVMDAATSSVLYGNASAALPGSSGVAVYFPANNDDYAIADNNQKYESEFGDKLPSWLSFLGTFYGTATATFQPNDLTIKITEVIPGDGSASIWDPPVVQFALNGTGIVDLQFFAAWKIEEENISVLLDASTLVFSYTDAEGEVIEQYPEGDSPNLEFSWNVEMPLMSDAGGSSEITVLISNPDNANEATVSGIYHWQNGDTSRAYLVVDLETKQVTQVFGIQESDDGQAVGEIRPTTGDTFEPQYRILDENGELQLEASGTQLVFSDTPFSFEFVPAVSGSYLFTMWVKDMAGNIVFDSVEFAVDSEGLDTAYRGFKDLGMGLNFLFPWGWSDPNVTINADESYTLDVSDPNAEITIIVDAYEVTSIDEILTIATDNLTTFGATMDEPESTTVTTYDEKTYDAYNLYYSYQTEDGTERSGGQLVVYVPDNGFGYIIDVDALAERAEEAGQVLGDIIVSIYFFPPQ